MDQDYHLNWFRQRLSKLFAIPEMEYVDVLINDNYEQLKRFFEEDFDCPRMNTNGVAGGGGGSQLQEQSLEGRILYVYRTFYDRLVEKEITVLEEVPHVQAAPEPEVKEKRKKGRGGGGGGAGAGNKEKRSRDLKDEDAEVKLDRDFLLDGAVGGAGGGGEGGNGDNDNAAAAGAAGTTSGGVIANLFAIV